MTRGAMSRSEESDGFLSIREALGHGQEGVEFAHGAALDAADHESASCPTRGQMFVREKLADRPFAGRKLVATEPDRLQVPRLAGSRGAR